MRLNKFLSGLAAVLFGVPAASVLGVIVLLFQALLLAHGGRDDVTLTPGREEAGIPSRWRKGDDWQGYLEHLLVRLHKQRTGLERSEKAADPTRLTYIQQAEKELTRLREQLMEGVWPL